MCIPPLYKMISQRIQDFLIPCRRSVSMSSTCRSDGESWRRQGSIRDGESLVLSVRGQVLVTGRISLVLTRHVRRAFDSMRIFTARTVICQLIAAAYFYRGFSCRRDATRRGSATAPARMRESSLPKGIEGMRGGFVHDERLSKEVSSRRFLSFFLPFHRFNRLSVRSVVLRFSLSLSSSVANECRSADARRSGWFDET